MTGAYVRVKRDGRWENVEFDQLADDEIEAFRARAGADPDEGWKWAKFLATWIRDNVRGEPEGGGA